MTKPAALKYVIELIRVSTMAQANEDRAGIPAQREVCRRVAGIHGLTIKWSIEIVGVSGASVMFSPEMRQLQEIVKSGECAGVVTREIDRLMRPENFEDFAIFEVLKEHSVMLYTESGVFDLAQPNDRLMVTVRGAMSGLERTLIINRFQGGKEAKRRKGICIAGPQSLPYACIYSKEAGWSYDPEKIAQVKLLFDLYAKGERNHRKLSRMTGITYPRIPLILTNPIYIGWYIVKWMVDPTAKKRIDDRARYRSARRILRPPEMVYKHKVFDKGAISDEQFAFVQKIVAARKDMHWRYSKEDDHFTYRGLLRCGICGAHMTTKRSLRDSGSVNEYYMCETMKGRASYRTQVRPACGARRMRREVLEELLDNLVGTKLSDPIYLSKLMEAQRQAIRRNVDRARLGDLERTLKSFPGRRSKLDDAYVNLGTLERDDYRHRRAEIDEQENTIRLEMAKLRPVETAISPELLRDLLVPFQDWILLKREEKRRLLMQTIPMFNVSAGVATGGSIRHCYLPPYVVNGFMVTLTGGEDAPPEGTAGVTAPSHRKAGRAKPRVNRGAAAGVPNSEPSSPLLTSDPLPPAVFSDRSIYFNLDGLAG
jgi:DNA invertase Pin-like site-specific DNA recombinase